jgi:hypothetical protein
MSKILAVLLSIYASQNRHILILYFFSNFALSALSAFLLILMNPIWSSDYLQTIILQIKANFTSRLHNLIACCKWAAAEPATAYTNHW